MVKNVRFCLPKFIPFILPFTTILLLLRTVDNPFAGRVICVHCGSPFRRKVWNSTDERLRRIIWRCNKKYVVKGEKSCENNHVDDKVLYQSFINTINIILENKDYFIRRWLQMKDSEDFFQRYKAQQFMEIIAGANPINRV